MFTEPSIRVVPAGKMLLHDEEVALPLGDVPGDVPEGGDGDPGLAAEHPPGWRWFSNVLGLTATPKPTGKTLPSSSGGAG